ncbi:MAG TPA: hemolysin family protein [Longimicrobiales bacterium]|nr:hemolysin family protein [Longimicrobiales bacterium]
MPSPGVAWQLAIILLLIVANGVFAMAEIAVVSSRKTRLKARADAGDGRARRALELAEHPNRFLSTVQIGITLIGIFAGAYGGATLAGPLAEALATGFPSLARYSPQIALAIVVAAITYLSLVLGELVPKRIGLGNPEGIAARIARPMHGLSVVAYPLVRLLSASTNGLLRLLPVRKRSEPPVTEAEIAAQLEAGTRAGVFEEAEQDMVVRVFRLADQRAGALLTPRHRIAWLDINDPIDVSRGTIIGHAHTRFPVCDGDLDNVLGMVHVADLLASALEGKPLELRPALRKPLYVPPSIRALRLLELFRESGVHMAIVVDEHGGTDGLITLNDVLEEISGELDVPEEERVVRRDDGSWLIDAGLSMDELRDVLALEPQPGRVGRGYRTLGGFLVHWLGHLPTSGESIVALGYRFEVVDMDGHRVDKVLVSRSSDVT